MQEGKAPKGGWGQIEDAFEFADLANKNTSDFAWIILWWKHYLLFMWNSNWTGCPVFYPAALCLDTRERQLDIIFSDNHLKGIWAMEWHDGTIFRRINLVCRMEERLRIRRIAGDGLGIILVRADEISPSTHHPTISQTMFLHCPVTRILPYSWCCIYLCRTFGDLNKSPLSPAFSMS